jgi:hypothetical protein
LSQALSPQIPFKKNSTRPGMVILATWEAEIGRITVWGQPGQRVQETPSQPMAGHSMACICHSSCAGSINRRFQVYASLGIKGDST